MNTGTSRKTISLPEDTAKRAEQNAAARGFANSFSAYMAWLIERDTAGQVSRESITRHEEPTSRVAEPTPQYPAAK